ncbi:MAG: CPBP family intramembrane metalloprotease [Candidatus Hydrogenedentota bacterium]|nr:MAG: CPBP family intramembrane metalloprotease [Candidatus Hydrogenedentota bacterium]
MAGHTKGRNLELTALLLVGILPFELNGLYNIHLVSKPLYFWAVEIISYIFLPLVIYSWGIHRGLFTSAEIGFHPYVSGRIHYTHILVVVLSPIIYFAYVYSRVLAMRIIPTNYGAVNFGYGQVVASYGDLRILVLLYFALTAGLVEEFFYRGLMHKLICMGKRRFIMYVFVSSLVFSSVHWELGVQGLLSRFLWGLVMASLYYRIRNIWPLVVGHMITDLIAFS